MEVLCIWNLSSEKNVVIVESYLFLILAKRSGKNTVVNPSAEKPVKLQVKENSLANPKTKIISGVRKMFSGSEIGAAVIRDTGERTEKTPVRYKIY